MAFPVKIQSTTGDNGGFCLPVLLIIFNRPDTRRAVIDQMREVRPREIFVFADGPRLRRPEEVGPMPRHTRSAQGVRLAMQGMGIVSQAKRQMS